MQEVLPIWTLTISKYWKNALNFCSTSLLKPEETQLVSYQVLSENWDLHIDPYSTPPYTSGSTLSIPILFFSNLIPREDFKAIH